MLLVLVNLIFVAAAAVIIIVINIIIIISFSFWVMFECSLWVTLQFPFSSLVESGLCSLGYACPSSVSVIAVVDENLMAILERPMHSLLFCSYFSPLLPCNSLCFLSLHPPKTSISFAYACALSNVDWLPFAPNLKLLNNEPENMYLYLCT